MFPCKFSAIFLADERRIGDAEKGIVRFEQFFACKVHVVGGDEGYTRRISEVDERFLSDALFRQPVTLPRNQPIPGFTSVTPAPTASTTPAPSRPSMNGSSRL